MKQYIFFLFVTVLIFTACGSDDNNDSSGNGFTANGTFYETNFAYNDIGGRAFIFSSVDRSLDSYTEVRGRFDLWNGGDNLEPFTYTTSNGGIFGVVEFDKDIIRENGTFASLGDSIAYTCCSEGTSNNFQSGSAKINSIEYAANGQVISIDVDYQFTWDNISIVGSYSGSVVEGP